MLRRNRLTATLYVEKGYYEATSRLLLGRVEVAIRRLRTPARAAVPCLHTERPLGGRAPKGHRSAPDKTCIPCTGLAAVEVVVGRPVGGVAAGPTNKGIARRESPRARGALGPWPLGRASVWALGGAA